MICGICKKNEATVHYSQLINGNSSEIHMCEECAKEKGMTIFPLDAPFSMGDILTGFVEQKEGMETEEIEGVACSLCGTTYSDFKKTGFLGCPDCYKTFKRGISSLLKRIHGASHHIGKSPVRFKDKVALKNIQELKVLRTELNKAIEEERYEDAAKLRDKTKELESKNKNVN